ncbi:MAG: nucleoside 2-deoxyribosyltransferase [Chloroflexi bacterium]|jgi:nucleoside 2-deoxyribosyltransferase|nr:nucleoside 2-deoxyribosyltransferase [Chloroflexota bacterium]
MNIYFACSITGGREFESSYLSIVDAMLADGHEVPTAHLATPKVRELEITAAPAEVYARDVDWVRNSDVLVAEVSTPSHGVGYEIGFALGLGKPVLACHRSDRGISKMISGNPDANLTVRDYATPAEAVQIVREYLGRPQVR